MYIERYNIPVHTDDRHRCRDTKDYHCYYETISVTEEPRYQRCLLTSSRRARTKISVDHLFLVRKTEPTRSWRLEILR